MQEPCFTPPQVVCRPLETFYSLHPEQRTFQDPRLKLHGSNASQKATTTAAEASALASHASSTADLAAGITARPDLT